MSDRYKVLPGSQSGHCCFDATVVDTHTPQNNWHGKEPRYEAVCECFDLADAELVAAGLNNAGGDRMRKVLERVRVLLDSVAYVATEGDTHDVLADIDKVLAGDEPTPQQKHIGYMVCSDGRYMYWPVEGLQEARTYCEDNVEPVKLMADMAELNKHEEGQV